MSFAARNSSILTHFVMAVLGNETKLGGNVHCVLCYVRKVKTTTWTLILSPKLCAKASS
jgi:hypothetical protein